MKRRELLQGALASPAAIPSLAALVAGLTRQGAAQAALEANPAISPRERIQASTRRTRLLVNGHDLVGIVRAEMFHEYNRCEVELLNGQRVFVPESTRTAFEVTLRAPGSMSLLDDWLRSGQALPVLFIPWGEGPCGYLVDGYLVDLVVEADEGPGLSVWARIQTTGGPTIVELEDGT
jgi:hypothetical protein